jgi:hypothetical protein
MAADLKRVTFSTPRAAEFLELRALQTQTGMHQSWFADVVLKELGDNGLDAAETAGTAPEVSLLRTVEGDLALVTVADNGPGLAPDVIERILDFNVLVSDKSACRSPTRSHQGNAWKTLLGIPGALGVEGGSVPGPSGRRRKPQASSAKQLLRAWSSSDRHSGRKRPAGTFNVDRLLDDPRGDLLATLGRRLARLRPRVAGVVTAVTVSAAVISWVARTLLNPHRSRQYTSNVRWPCR